MPLAALLKLALVFPDEAPSRFRTALRAGTTAELEGRLEQAQEGADADTPVEAAERLLGFVAALSAHDRVTRGHSERVRAYSQMIAKELHLGRDEVDRLNWAALLHDIGKLGVPAEVLNKPGEPTAEEWELIRSHPEHGARLAEPLRAWLGEWTDAVSDHHERWDGTGYPNGTAGERHLARRPHRGRRRRVRRHHLRAFLQGIGHGDHRARGDRALRRRRSSTRASCARS